MTDNFNDQNNEAQNAAADDADDDITPYTNLSEADSLQNKCSDSKDDSAEEKISQQPADVRTDEIQSDEMQPVKKQSDEKPKEKIQECENIDIKEHEASADDSRTQKNAALDSSKNDGEKSGSKLLVYKILQILCIIGFIILGALFINEVLIQPIRIKNSIEKTRDLYKSGILTPIPSIKPEVTVIPDEKVTIPPDEPSQAPTPTPDPTRDELGRLLQFSELLAVNEDVKGWITIPDTNIDYVVVQSGKDDPYYYLDKDIYHQYSKAGTLFLDVNCSVEENTQSLIIYGHNMVSTPEKMFRYLTKYKVEKSGKNKVSSFYKEHPVIKFDTIYQTGEWKIFSVFITNGAENKKDEFFDYTRSRFADASDFLNYVYQLRIRSELNIDCVDITDTDQILILSTCSYEVDNYRTVIVARKVRDGEDPFVDVDSVTVNKNPLFPASYYYRYGGKAPKLPETFEEALASGLINWYTPPDQLEEKMKEAASAWKAKIDEAEANEDNSSDADIDIKEDNNADAEVSDNNAEAEANGDKKAGAEGSQTDKATTEGSKSKKAGTNSGKSKMTEATSGNSKNTETKSGKSKKSKTEAAEKEVKKAEEAEVNSAEGAKPEANKTKSRKSASDDSANNEADNTDADNANASHANEDGNIADEANPETTPMPDEANTTE